jgi:tRNA(fMet)-specific endonuclease VapC
MDAVLLDTDVFSYLIKNDDRAEPYRQHIVGKTLAISFVTVGELYYGAEKKGWGTANLQKLETRIRSVVIVPFDLDVCREYARICALKTDSGSDRTIGANDRWIAACAMRHKLPLISNNRKHFEGIPGLVLIAEARKPNVKFS